MGTQAQLFLPLNINQLFMLIRQLSVTDKKKLIQFLIKDEDEKETVLTHFASEKILAKDWLKPEEDEAWKNL